MPFTATRRAPATRRVALLVGCAILLAGCKSAAPPPAPVDPDAKAPINVTVGEIRMPQGVDLDRLRMLDEVRMTKVYVEVLASGDRSDDKLLFPREMTQALNLSPRAMTRRFVDTIAKSRRFEVYDISSTVTAEQSDYVVDGMVTSAVQELVPSEGGTRVSATRVRLSVQMKNRYSGELLFPAPVEVVGQTGRATGDRVVLVASDNLNDPTVQRRLAVDYERALQRAFDDAAQRIEWVLRPLGRVVSVDGSAVGIVGGLRHGLQAQDRLVIFRTTTTRVGGKEVVASTRPIAVIACEGVGTITSQCDITRRNPQLQAQPGDYAVLTDDSLKQARFQ